MIRDICKDETFLAQKAEPATPDDLSIAADLLETLEHHKAGCVGMAANMIGVNKRIIAFDNEGTYMVMFNPEIIKQSGPYEAEEGCLSLTGTRPAKRWKSIKVRWQNEKFQERLKTFTGWTAQIIQHEIDHCEGIIYEKNCKITVMRITQYEDLMAQYEKSYLPRLRHESGTGFYRQWLGEAGWLLPKCLGYPLPLCTAPEPRRGELL